MSAAFNSEYNQRDTGEIIKVYEIDDIAVKSDCPSCYKPEADRIWISANQAYCYCFECAIEWIVQGLNWEGKE